MADKSAEKERLFNEWFTKSYDRLRGTLRRYGMLDEDNFHDTYLFVRRQVLVPGKDITDYDAYFIGCYKKAALIKIKRENRYAHPEDDFFLRCGEEAKFLSEDDLNGCERLVRDILRFVRQKFSYEEYRMFMLRFYEAQFSFKALAECMGISASAISQKVLQDSGRGTYPQRFRMEKSDAGGGKLHVLKNKNSSTDKRRTIMALIVYNRENSRPQEVTYKGKRTINLDSRGTVYLSKTMSIELGILGGGRVNFAHDDETGDWYICRADDSEGFIVWKDKRCARFSAGFIVQRLMRQAKVERKSVQFMMARMPVEIGGVAYYKILLSNPILR